MAALEGVEGKWREILEQELKKPYMQDLKSKLKEEKQRGVYYYPHPKAIFKALEFTPFEKVKVVILGQDPYHGPGQAMGLAFSVKEGMSMPPSLKNIWKELHNEYGIHPPKDELGKPSGDLSGWAKQGVLLLNTSLTVRPGEAASHSSWGWQRLTDKIIMELSHNRHGLVFLLWGSHAQAKASLIDSQKHHVLKAPHPSPLSAHRGFFGCNHFKSANEILQKQGLEPIEWQQASTS